MIGHADKATPDDPAGVEQGYADRVEAQLAVLAQIARDIEAHIEQRAQQIASPQILFERERNNQAIQTVQDEARFDAQRKDDLIRELRRQLDAQVKTSERLHREVKETREAVRRVEALKVWTNEDRKQFVFADELWEALAGASSPARRETAAFLASRRATETTTREQP